MRDPFSPKGRRRGYFYGFNGKEKIDEQYGIEGTSYDYGFRVYDSRIAKFLSVDPLFRSFAYYTPYQFAGNKPIIAVDLDGLEEYYVIRWVDQDGAHQSSAIRLQVEGQIVAGTPIDQRLPGHNDEEAYVVYMQIGTNKITHQGFGTLNDLERKAELSKTGGSEDSPNKNEKELHVGDASGKPAVYKDWYRWEGNVTMPPPPPAYKIVTGNKALKVDHYMSDYGTDKEHVAAAIKLSGYKVDAARKDKGTLKSITMETQADDNLSKSIKANLESEYGVPVTMNVVPTLRYHFTYTVNYTKKEKEIIKK